MLEKDVSTLLGFRESIRVLDATLRDGGLCNDHHFSDEFVKALYQTNIKAGVDYMELGYKASKELFSTEKYGKWKFTDDEDVLDVIGDNQGTGLKLAVMADAGRCDYKNDIRPRSESPIDMIRVAAYINQMPAALHMIEDAKNKGYEVACNIMAISAAQEESIKVALSMLGQSPVDVVYIVDSFGALYPEEINRNLTGRIAELHFAPTENNKNNLLRENVPEENIFVTGNTVIDAIKMTAGKPFDFENETLKSLDFEVK